MFSFENITALLGLLLTIAIPIFSYYWVKKSKFYFLKKNDLKLYDDVVKVFPDISIKYKGEDIVSNLVLFSGTLILKGHYDIKSEDIDVPIYIEPNDKNAIWKEFKITNSNNDFNPNFTIDGNKVIISKSLLKKNDYFSFWGLVDSKSNHFHIGHRVYNLPPQTIFLNESRTKLYEQGILMYLLAFIFFAIFTLFISLRTTMIFKPNADKVNFATEKVSNFDFDKQFLKYQKKFNIDSIKAALRITDSVNSKNASSNFRKVSDSLLEIVKLNPTFENKFKLRDFQASNFTKALESSSDKYSLMEAQSDTLLGKRIQAKNLILKKPYKINDSISVSFNRDSLVGTSADNNYIFLSILLLMNMLLFIMTSYYSYKYWLIKRITKKFVKKQSN